MPSTRWAGRVGSAPNTARAARRWIVSRGASPTGLGPKPDLNRILCNFHRAASRHFQTCHVAFVVKPRGKHGSAERKKALVDAADASDRAGGTAVPRACASLAAGGP